MDLNALRIFVSVVENGSFVAAGRATDTPKSTVARRIEDLEADLGVRLWQRNTRKSELTEAGRAFYERCRVILDEIDDAVASVAEHQQQPQGRLRFTTSVLLAETYVGKWVTDYLEHYPLVELDMFLSARNLDLLADGFDLALRVGPMESSSHIVKRLAPAPSYICASPRYLESHPALEGPEDLPRHRAVVFSPDRSRVDWTLEDADGNRVSAVVPGRIVVNSYPVALEACRRHLGLADLPALVCCDALRSGELVRVLPRWSTPARWLHALYPSRHHLTATVRTLLDFIEERLTPTPWAID